MAQEFKLLLVLCLVAASVVSVPGTSTPVPAASSTAAGGTSAPVPAASSTAAGGTSAPIPAASSTATGGTSAPVPAASSTAAGGTSTPVPAASSTAAGGASTPVPGASSTAAGGTSAPVPAASSTAAGGASTPVPGASSTAAGGTSAPVPAASSTAAGGTSAPVPAASSTAAGGASTPVPATSSTAAGGTSTPVPAGSSTAAGGTTATPTAPPTNTTSEITTPPQPTSDPCAKSPCGQGSTCVPRANSTYLCLCLAGDFYNDESQSCVNAKVFPGQLEIPDLPYSPEMADKLSEEFLEAAVKISNALKDSFNRSDFSGSTVLEIREIIKSRVWSRSGNWVHATVEIFFKASSTITTQEFQEEMINATKCDNCFLKGANFSASPLCDNKTCDAETASCSASDGVLSCDCLGGYIKTDFSDRMCIACPSGKKASKDQKQCEDCPFGYSGLNCKESWQLILVIVGSVLGGLLLIMLIVLPVVALKSSKKSSKKSKYANAGEPYIGPTPVKAPLGNSGIANSQAAPVNGSANAFANAGMPRIPRATTPSSWDRTNLEMTPSNSRQNLIPAGRNSRLYEDQDDFAPYAQSRPQSSLYGQARPQSSLYDQARPQSNPYTQSRPQVNPYSSSQGLSNPYYTHDNGRRFN